MYYFLLAVSVLVFLGLRYVSRTAFGLALQGVRDDPVRMAALGYNVRLHRTLGFTLAAPVAGAAGVLSAWSNTRMSAGSISAGDRDPGADRGRHRRAEPAGGGLGRRPASTRCATPTCAAGPTGSPPGSASCSWSSCCVSPGGVVGCCGSAGTWVRRHLPGAAARTGPAGRAAPPPVPVSSNGAL